MILRITARELEANIKTDHQDIQVELLEMDGYTARGWVILIHDKDQSAWLKNARGEIRRFGTLDSAWKFLSQFERDVPVSISRHSYEAES